VNPTPQRRKHPCNSDNSRTNTANHRKGSEYRRECHYFVQYVYVSVHDIVSFSCIIRPLYRIISLPTASHGKLYVILLINHCTSVPVNLSLGISPDTS